MTLAISYTVPQETKEPAAAPKEKLTHDSAYAIFKKAVLKAAQEMANDTHLRMEGCKKDIRLLNQGIFYGNEYGKALMELTQSSDERTKNVATVQLNALIKTGAFFHGIAPKEFFEMPGKEPAVGDPTGKDPCEYILKKDVRPSEAIQAWRTKRIFLGCGEWCYQTYYAGLLALWGPEKFDRCFAATSPTPLRIRAGDHLNPILILCQNETAETEDEVPELSKVHFRNADLYCDKQFNGEDQGSNMLRLPGKERRYIGLETSSKGWVSSEIKEHLRLAYNAKPIGNALLTKEVGERILEFRKRRGTLAVTKALETHTFSAEEFAKTARGFIPQIVSINMDRVVQIANATLDEAPKLLAGWQLQAIKEGRINLKTT